MKKTILLLMLFAVLAPRAHACVGKTLTIGAAGSLEEQLLAELVAAMINERTGTSVQVRSFASRRELAEAVRAEQVDISFGNTSRALVALNKRPETDPDKALEVVRTTYERDQGLVWLKPFGFRNDGSEGQSYTATVLRGEVLNNYPALPRIIGKLSAAINDEAYAGLIRSMVSDTCCCTGSGASEGVVTDAASEIRTASVTATAMQAERKRKEKGL